MSGAIILRQHGGPEVLEWVALDPGRPGEGQVLLRHTAIGLNFIDIYVRTGLYKMGTMPCSPGMEAAGVVEAVGPGVTGLGVGDRVAYVTGAPGAYVERRVMSAAALVKLPDDISEDQAAALMLKGMTAEMLLFRMTQAKAGDAVLIHAVAGGVGLLLAAWAKSLGCQVIGAASSDEKAAKARAAGADHVIVTSREDVATRVQELTGGRGCRCVYDGVGKDTFETSLAAVAEFGHVVSYGNASGPVPPFAIAGLAPKCATLSRPSIFPFIKDRARLDAMSGNLFQAMRQGVIKAEIDQVFALKDAAAAQSALESRQTTGQTILRP
ncbi:quinone oxidoreductase [Bosea sp. 124]|uniref:quinone oxidoreductase family protein n=1 Tax=Bosea sp. 124 TaxID=2135642 RepID=UPI000D3AFEB2|nr:quinone oxidoreductase [Bosea sp. 124]PTM39858.1 NADPH:quinone reductase-like Zn-dependent oxidoreductase [Bosea sp. 124]